ncbi:MAG TPA: redoxin family protein [Ramlibacter sp.]|jgi:cytochrome c biogenesis protein CcdA/thiol-disulfide isomerase/thioredoxin|nr:redoxin family protein [Ramlibacter sp.]
MTIVFALIAFLGGLLTIASPCILPVLPFLFAPGRSFRSHTLPMLTSMALGFAAIAMLTAVGAAWAVTLHVAARYAALALLALFGTTLLVPRLAEALSRPLVRLGARMADGSNASPLAPWALGLGTALLWTPCAGPILGVLLATGVLHGPNVGTAILLFAYAAGAASGLGAAWWFGHGLGAALRRSMPAAGHLRRAAGLAVLAAVAVPALGLDATVLARISLPASTRLEQSLIERVQFAKASEPHPGALDALRGASAWINTQPLDAAALRGKVVLVNFWTYSCINCLRALPHVKAWAEKYKADGLVVVGVHTPEFAFEKHAPNVMRAVAELGITYPVAMDNEYRIWRSLHNAAWPGFFFIDARGRVRHEVAGEHAYDRSERLLQQLLADAGHAPAPGLPVRPTAEGTQAPPNLATLRSGESYIGYAQARGFDSASRLQKDLSAVYTPAAPVRNGAWTLSGEWRIESERGVATRPQARIVHRFHARDLHMVLGAADAARPVRFRVLLDGMPPGADHGTDTNAQGEGVIRSHKLHQLVRQRGPVKERLFEIEFLDEGAEAYAFTFG